MKIFHVKCQSLVCVLFVYFFANVCFVLGVETGKDSLLGNISDGVVMIVGGDSVLLSDFAYIYKKNIEEATNSDKSFEEYVELFTVFQLKVHEARVQGIDTTQSFDREFRSYRSQATIKYMRDEATLDSLIGVGYDRMSRDRFASHIALSCPSNASDSLKEEVWKKINTVRQLAIEAPDRFNQIAIEYSNDPNVQQNEGKLGWIRPYRYVYNFEEAVYNTPVGGISDIFKTPFGYHIVKVDEERPHEEIYAKHIMKMFDKDVEESRFASKRKIDSIYALLKHGADFAEVAQTESDDKGSSVKGGDLGWFGRGMMVRPFEEMAFKTSDNALSEPFESDYGWHIIYKMGHRSMLPLDSMKKQILNSIERDERMKIADSIFVKKMRAFYHLPDSLSHSDVRKYVDEHLEERYEDLRHTVKEYHDGIMLFEVSLNEVWNKAGTDTIGLQKYFNANKTKYQWNNPKFKGFVVQCSDERNAKMVEKIFKNNLLRSPDSIISYVNSIINVDSVPFVLIRRGLWGKGDNPLIDRDVFSVKTALVDVSPKYPIVFVKGKKIKSPEDYKDVRSDVVSDYQDTLEKEWVETLKKKYPVSINKNLLEQYKNYISH